MRRSELITDNMRAGFTLIEIIIYIAILGLIATSLVTYSVSVSLSRRGFSVVREVQENARVVMGGITRAIRFAESVNSGASVFDSDNGILELTLTDVAESPTRFFRDPEGRVFIQRGALAPEQMTSAQVEVTRLRFSDYDGVVRIEITVRHKGGGSGGYSYEYVLTGSADLRL